MLLCGAVWYVLDSYKCFFFISPIRKSALSVEKNRHCQLNVPLLSSLLSFGWKAGIQIQTEDHGILMHNDCARIVFFFFCVRAPQLSGPLDRLNAILSLLQPLDRYRAPSAIGSAIGRPLSRPISHPRTGRSPQPPRSKPLRGLNRAIVAL